ncbi:MAG: hypothetical protein HYX67_06590 [Candidatus Melainabacteria bacterium]|nr:hypothetical protein [Candidatus Melainabacteria bacterium]
MRTTARRLFIRCASNHRLAAVVLLILLSIPLFGFYALTLSGQKTFFIADHTYYFEPFTNFIGKALAAHKLPLWNPYIYCGMPQAAVPSPGMFYPPNIAFAYLGYSQALSVILLFNQLAMGLGAFLLVASFGWGLTAATVASITLTFCGYMFSLENNYTLVAGAAWTPLMLWAYRRIKIELPASRPYFASAIAIFATFMCIAAGRPEVFVPACLITALSCLRDAYLNHKNGTSPAPHLVWQFGSMVAAVLLTMPIVLPVIEWVMQSPRANGLNLSQTFMWSVNWYDLIGMFCAYPFGDLQILGAHHLNLVATRPVFLPFVPSCYIGPIAMTCAIWGFSDKSWQNRELLTIYSGCLLILCLGEYTPITPALMQAIPALTTFRYPIKWMIFLILAFALAAARGASILARSEVSRAGRISAISFWGLSLLAAIFFLSLALTNTSLQLAKPPLPVEAELWLGQSFLISAAVGFCTGGLEWLRRNGKLSALQTSVMLPCFIAINLLIPAYKFQQLTTSPQFFSKDSFMLNYLTEAKNDLVRQNAKTGDGRFLSLYFDPFWTPPYYRSKYDQRWTPAFFDYARNLLLPNTNLDKQVPETFGYEAAETGSYRKLFFDILHQCSVCLPGGRASDRQADSQHYSDVPLLRFCQCTATSWVGTQSWKGPNDVPKLDARYFNLVKEDKVKNVRLYHVKYQLPRAYLTRYWKWCDSQKPVLEKIRTADLSEYNPAVITLVEQDATSGSADIKGTDRDFGPILARAPAHSPPIPAEIEHADFAARDPFIDTFPVSILTDEPEHISLSVKGDRDSFLVLTDHFYPGWQASIDGAKRQCYRVNTEGRAVYVPAGAHLIEFNYFPESLTLGFQLATAGAATFFLLIAAGLRPYVWRFLKFIAGQQ